MKDDLEFNEFHLRLIIYDFYKIADLRFSNFQYDKLLLDSRII